MVRGESIFQSAREKARLSCINRAPLFRDNPLRRTIEDRTLVLSLIKKSRLRRKLCKLGKARNHWGKCAKNLWNFCRNVVMILSNVVSIKKNVRIEVNKVN